MCLNGIIGLCLVWVRQLGRPKKVALRAGVELPVGTYPVELKGEGVHEMDCAPLELTEDTLHEMHVQPPELTGNMWPELEERSSKVSVPGTV